MASLTRLRLEDDGAERDLGRGPTGPSHEEIVPSVAREAECHCPRRSHAQVLTQLLRLFDGELEDDN